MDSKHSSVSSSAAPVEELPANKYAFELQALKATLEAQTQVFKLELEHLTKINQDSLAALQRNSRGTDDIVSGFCWGSLFGGGIMYLFCKLVD